MYKKDLNLDIGYCTAMFLHENLLLLVYDFKRTGI